MGRRGGRSGLAPGSQPALPGPEAPIGSCAPSSLLPQSPYRSGLTHRLISMDPLITSDATGLLTVAETAMLCCCSAPTVRRRIHEGELPAVQLGAPGKALRVRRDELDAWLMHPRPPRSRGRAMKATSSGVSPKELALVGRR